MDTGARGLHERLEDGLWPLVEAHVREQDVSGLAVAVVRDGEVVARGFGVRDVRTGEPVTPETMFHLASVSKPFVATAVVGLSLGTDGADPVLDLDAPLTRWVPELSLADGRQDEVTARGLLSHTSGLPDVTDYGWHEPRLDDDALGDLARSLSGWRLRSEPGTAFSYSNAGYELLGLLLARATGSTFEDAVSRLVLEPLGLRRSTFLRAQVPRHLAASPHVGMPLAVPGDAYPYTRRHAPSSTLHSNLEELGRWVVANVGPRESTTGALRPGLGPDLLDLVSTPVVEVGEPPWEEAMALGWAAGRYRGQRTLGHSGEDPGFGSRVVLVPSRRTGVVLLANCNTVPSSSLTAAALDVALADVPLDGATDEGVARLRALRRPVVGPVAEVLATSGPDAAAAAYHRLAALDPPEHDLDDEGFADAVWGAVELHRTELAWPVLRLWTDVRPASSTAWEMTGWAHQVDGHLDRARSALRRSLDLDPGNEDAAQLLAGLPLG